MNVRQKKAQALFAITIVLLLTLSSCVFFIFNSQKIHAYEESTMDEKFAFDAQSMTIGSDVSDYEDAQGSFGNQIVIQNVPIYMNFRGCGPTAAGIVLGYYDGQGFPDLIDGDASTQTSIVNSMISSQENWDDYCLPIDSQPGPIKPDKSEYPTGDEHEDNCIADFMKTSQSAFDNYYGWSWFSNVDNALLGYVNWATPQYEASATSLIYNGYSTGLTWAKFCAEIDAKRPVILLVDKENNDGVPDHFVTAIGYDDSFNYACYNVIDSYVHWYDFTKYAPGNPYGVYGAIFFSLSVLGSQLTYSPHSYDFGTMNTGMIDFTTLQIWNAGTEELSYSLSESCSWVELTPSSGISTGEHDQIIISVDTTNLDAGIHSCDILINSDGGNGIFTVSLNVVSETALCDEQQIQYNNKFSANLNNWIAQSFKPTEDLLTRVEVYIDKLGSPTTDLVVSIRSSLTGADLTSKSVSCNDISSSMSWVEFDFSDISIVPEGTYFIVLRTSGGNSFNSFEWGFGYYTSYARGSFWRSSTSGSSWTEYTSFDFCFKTYGNSESGSSPNTPLIPSGPTTLLIGTSGTYSTSAIDPDGDQVKYRFYWGDGTFSSWTNLVNSGQSSSRSTAWNSAGTYVVKAQARDFYGLTSGWSTGLNVIVTGTPNTAPNAPSIPSGPINLYTGQSGSYSTSATDPDGDRVQYRFNWGDGVISGWTGLVDSGTSASLVHSWFDEGSYFAKAQARDEYGSTSTWSDDLTVTIIAPPNTDPNAPSIPSGPINLYTGQSGSYSTSATDPDGDRVQYRFNWGDGVISGWTGLVDSGTSASLVHSWFDEGSYFVKAQARDEYGSTSTWSAALVVNVVSSVAELDQQQTKYDYKFTEYSSTWAAQSFKPTLGTLTGIEIYVDKKGSPTSDLVVSIRSSLTGTDLTSKSVSYNDISSSISWVEFDFSDISVVPESTYFIVLRTSGGNSFNAFEWGFGYYTSYARGSFWRSTSSGSSWNEYSSYDFCFKTYGQPAGPAIPVLSYTPSSYNFGNMLQGTTGSTTFQVWNSGTGTLSYALSEGCSWITSVVPSSGTSTGEHDVITINIDTSGLSTGSYNYGISINSNGGNNVFTVSVTMIPPAPLLSYNPNSYDFGDKIEGMTGSTTFQVWNSGTGTLSYALSEGCSWITSVVPSSGTSTGEHDVITINIDTSGLSTGSYNYDISINSNGGNNVFTISLTIIAPTEWLDQQQTKFDNKFSANSNNWVAQSFKPSEDLLTRVEVYIDKLGSPTTDLVVSIRSSLTGVDLTSKSVSCNDISSSMSWVEFDFSDISVVPEGTYFIVLRTSGGNSFNSFEWGFGYYTSYARGSFWRSTSSGSSWNEYSSYDFCFKTYGI